MVAETNTPLSVRNLNICSSHCHFVASAPALAAGEVHRIVNDSGYSRRVRIVMVQQSGPPHQRLAFVLAKLLDHDAPRPGAASRRTASSRPLPKEPKEPRSTQEPLAERTP